MPASLIKKNIGHTENLNYCKGFDEISLQDIYSSDMVFLEHEAL